MRATVPAIETMRATGSREGSGLSEGRAAELQEMLDAVGSRYEKAIPDVVLDRLRSFFESKLGTENDARARECLARFRDTDVVTLQRCALNMR